MLNQLIDIITNQSICTVFQPIIEVQNSQIIGYEALTRGPENSIFFSPEMLFKAAIKHGLLSELEILCRDNAIKQFAALQLVGKLFLNISPMVLLNSAHPQGTTVKFVEQSGLSCQQIVIEISEKYPFPQGDILHNALEKYREFGFAVAIDDLGAGYSGLKQWCMLQPDIVKIDRYFVANCDQDQSKQTFLKHLFLLGHNTDAMVIAEGIETQAEYELLTELGMRYAQGFFIARPALQPSKLTILPNFVPTKRKQLELVYCQG